MPLAIPMGKMVRSLLAAWWVIRRVGLSPVLDTNYNSLKFLKI